MQRLGREWLQGAPTGAGRAPEDLETPPPPTLLLPEKVLQFGAGVFLRAFVADFIQQANTRGDFGGRVVVVQRAPDARREEARRQDSLYTLWLRGLSDGRPSDTRRVIGSISRILAASEEWGQVLELVRRPELEIIISNATEVGYTVDPQDLSPAVAVAGADQPPRSFPARLARVLWERFEHFRGDTARAPVVIPCELLENNGAQLRAAVLDLADRWSLPPPFLQWVEEDTTFAGTLVDRIVTGPPSPETMEAEWARLGYRDELLIAAEPYYLFAVEDPDGRVRAILPLHHASPGVLFTADIGPYWRRKLKLLNGPHTLLAPQGLMAGCRTVKEAVGRPDLRQYLEEVMIEEIAPTLGDDLASTQQFARQVLERFANPYVEHLLANISVNCAAKAGVRVFPVVRAFHEQRGALPQRLLQGIAAVLLYTRGGWGEVRDPSAAYFCEQWARVSAGTPIEEFAATVLAHGPAWSGQTLDSSIFAAPVAAHLKTLLERHA